MTTFSLPHRLSSRLPPICRARLPRSGLGNMLLVWARAAVFAHENQMDLLTTGFASLRLGPWIRFERHKRVYVADFQPSSPLHYAHAELLSRIGHIVHEPKVGRLPEGERKPGTVYDYHELPDFYLSFAEHRDFVKRELLRMLTDARREEAQRLPAPVIGVHVRRGDFGEPKPGQDVAKNHGPTPLSHFIRLISGIREVTGEVLPVTVFSDAKDEALGPLLSMPAVSRAPDRAAIVDLLLLSRSRVVIPSAWSTFSLWSGFLADAPVLLHPMEHEHLCSIRPAEKNRVFYEGTVPERVADWPSLLVENLLALKGIGLSGNG